MMTSSSQAQRCGWGSDVNNEHNSLYGLRVDPCGPSFLGPIAASVEDPDSGVGYFVTGSYLCWAPLSAASPSSGGGQAAIIRLVDGEVVGDHISSITVVQPCPCATSSASGSSTLVLTVGPVVIGVRVSHLGHDGAAPLQRVVPCTELIDWRTSPPLEVSTFSRELQPPRVVHCGVLSPNATSPCLSLAFVTVAGGVIVLDGVSRRFLPAPPAVGCPPLGLSFAAATVDLCVPGKPLLAVVAFGSYSGRVLVRFLCQDPATGQPVLVEHLEGFPRLADIRAHQPGCAIFKVRARKEGPYLYVSTAADDRTATLWRYETGARTEDSVAAMPLHTLGGASPACGSKGVSHSPAFTGRVWDADFLVGEDMVTFGAAGEDGTVCVVQLNGKFQVSYESRTEGLFDTRGCRCLMLRSLSGKGFEVVSAGMDGRVMSHVVPRRARSPSLGGVAMQTRSSLRCLALLPNPHQSFWALCAIDDAFNIHLWSGGGDEGGPSLVGVWEGAGLQLCPGAGKPSCLQARWITADSVGVWLGTDRGCIAFAELCCRQISVLRHWMIPTSAEGTPSKIGSIALSACYRRVAFVEAVGRRVGTLSCMLPGGIDWLPTPLNSTPGDALSVEDGRIIVSFTSNDSVAIFTPMLVPPDTTWCLSFLGCFGLVPNLRQTGGGSNRKRGCNVNGVVRGGGDFGVSSLRVVQGDDGLQETLVVALSNGQILLRDLEAFAAGPVGANWVVTENSHACSMVTSLDQVVDPETQRRATYMFSTSGTTVSLGVMFRSEGPNVVLGGNKMLDLLTNMKAKRLLSSTCYWCPSAGSALGVFAFSPDSKNIEVVHCGMDSRGAPQQLDAYVREVEFSAPGKSSHERNPSLTARVKSKDLHCVAAVGRGAFRGCVAGCEDGSLVAVGSVDNGWHSQILQGGTDSNVLGVASGTLLVHERPVQIVVSVGSFSSLCLWMWCSRGFALLHKQDKGASAVQSGSNDSAIPRYLGVRVADDASRIVVATSSGELLLFKVEPSPASIAEVSLVGSVLPHTRGGLASPIFALDACFDSNEVVSGDKQGRLYYGDLHGSGSLEVGSGTLTTLVTGSPINAIAMTKCRSPDDGALAVVGFDTSDLMVVSCWRGRQAVPLRNIGLGFTCIRCIAPTPQLNIFDVLCDGEFHTVRLLPQHSGDSVLERLTSKSTAVRCSSAMVTFTTTTSTAARCIVGQGMEMSEFNL